jgi:hypothetical protein
MGFPKPMHVAKSRSKKNSINENEMERRIAAGNAGTDYGNFRFHNRRRIYFLLDRIWTGCGN